MTAPVKPRAWLFAGGGTGGHLTPGLAVAAALRRRDPDCRILFAGTDRQVEGRLLAETGYERLTTPFRPPGELLRTPFRWLATGWKALREADRLFVEQSITGVIGLGGYSCFPHVRTAALRGIPVVLLEQNALPGRAVRWLAKRVDHVCVSFDSTCGLLPRGVRCQVVGNPVRPEIAGLADTARAARPFTLLVLGGSLGATPLNDAVRSILESGRWSNRPWRILHQTGPADIARVEWSYRKGGACLDDATTPRIPTPLSARVEPFFTDMPSLYREATLVVSRAGATTLAELACAGLPSILVPYPHAASNHQAANAEIFRHHGASHTIPQHTDPARTGEAIARIIEELWPDLERLNRMSIAARGLAHPDAADRVAELLLESAANR